jgi:hypothetical protein
MDIVKSQSFEACGYQKAKIALSMVVLPKALLLMVALPFCSLILYPPIFFSNTRLEFLLSKDGVSFTEGFGACPLLEWRTI